MTTDRSVGRDETIAILHRLVSFDTESSRSNLDLIDYVEGYLRDLGVASARMPNAAGDKATYDTDVKGFVDLAFSDVPRIPLYQPFVNVAMQKNISGYQYWFHRRLDYRALVKG